MQKDLKIDERKQKMEGKLSWITEKTNNRGITLVALVITIIVLLILAGVSINLVAR